MAEAQQENLIGLTLAEMGDRLAALGQPAYRARQLCAWIYPRGETRWEAMTDLPAQLRELLAASFRLSWPETRRTLVSDDGTVKYLLGLDDGDTVEAVRLLYRYGPAFCLSTQVGCGMGCVFCASGAGGLARNLTAGEILGQAQRLRADLGMTTGAAGAGGRGGATGPAGAVGPSFHVVLMGSGEPLANFDATLRFIEILHAPWGLAQSHRHVTLSTCGLVPQIRRLATLGLPVNLSISLHAPNDRLRPSLMPGVASFPVRDVVAAADDYAKATGRRVTYEYSLFKGVNDSVALARELGRLLSGRLAHVNLIPGNPVPGTGLAGSSGETIRGFAVVLHETGVPVTVRRELGSDINAACGQLRGKARAGEKQ